MTNKATYYLTLNATGTAFTGIGYTPDGTIPKEVMPCTQEQAQNWQQYVPSNGEIVAAPSNVLLQQAKSAQIAMVTQGYEAAIAAPVTYKTAAGVTAMFSTDAKAVSYLQSVIAAASAAWTANLWLDSKGTPVTPFTFADVQGLAAAIENADTPDYQELLKLIGEINGATTVTEVQTYTFS